MIAAFAFLIGRSTRNKFAAQLQRLRNPRYLVAAFVGIAYFVLIFWNRSSGRTAGAVNPLLGHTVEALSPLVILFVLGSIYMGWTTPTEAGALGVVGAFFFALITNSLTWDVFKESLAGAVRTSCMIMLIVMGAAYLSNVIGYLGITRALTRYVTMMELSPYMLIVILTVLYLILGCLVDGFSMIVMTAPIVLPLIEAAKFDTVWFGIYLVLMIELAQITPPVGFNLFVISGLNNDDLVTIARASMPFFFIMLLATVLLTVFPDIALYLPNRMIGK